MVKVQVTETVACTPDEFLEFVMDIECYAEVDKKISRILWQRREATFWSLPADPRLPGCPNPRSSSRRA